MLSEKVTERIAERLVDRIEDLNTTILEEIGKAIKEIGKLNTSRAYQVLQELQYGGSYNKIINKLKQVTNLNEKQIYEIFEEVAKQDQNFAKQFYKYRDIDYIPYEKNKALQNQVRAIAKITADQYVNLMNTSAFMTIENGRRVYTPLSQIYQKTLDKAVLSLSQGKESYNTAMRKAMRELTDNGITTIDYASGYRRRLDSSVRMSVLDGMRNVSNQLQVQFGEEFGADGVEISVHENPAPDHENIQGKQYSNEAFEKINNRLKRPISTMNCYHYIFSIVLGVSKPLYSEEQLKEIKKKNKEGFDFEGKHYTMYEGTQLQRQMETKIRTLKDRQIGAKAMGDYEEVGNCQRKITQINHKYNDLCEVSGLKPKRIRMQVSGYKRSNINNIQTKSQALDRDTILNNLKSKNIEIDKSVLDLNDKELINKNLNQLNILSNKYNHNKISTDTLTIEAKNKESIGTAYYYGHRIEINKKLFNDQQELFNIEKQCQDLKWHNNVKEKDYNIYTITHEYGHIVEYEYLKERFVKQGILPSRVTKKQRAELDSDLRDTLVDRAISKLDTKIGRREFKNTYWSGYARKRNNFEWFAEAFAENELGNNNNVWTETFKEWLDEFNR